MNTLQNTDNNIIIPLPTSNLESGYYSFSVKGESKFELEVCRTEAETSFSGKFSNEALPLVISQFMYPQILDLAITAINNRTRERNFARLNEQLAMGIISEEEFDEEIDKNEDKYVIKCDVKPSIQEIENAIMLSRKIMDVDDTDDLSLLYSFDESSINSHLLK